MCLNSYSWWLWHTLESSVNHVWKKLSDLYVSTILFKGKQLYYQILFFFSQKNQVTIINISFVASCIAPKTVTNGTIEYSVRDTAHYFYYHKGSPVNGTVPEETKAFVHCSEGYLISGESNHTCVNGHWNLPTVTCIGNQNNFHCTNVTLQPPENSNLYE